MRLAAEEYDLVVAQLRALAPEEWTRPTDCPGWDVRALACHMLGMAEMSASMREQIRQMRTAKKAGGVFIDALTGLQVSERAELTPAQIIEPCRTSSRSGRGRPARPSDGPSAT